MKAIEKIEKMSFTQKVLLLIGCLLVVLLPCKAGQLVFKKSNFNNLRQTSVAVVLSPLKSGLICDIGQFSGTLISKSQFAVAPKVSDKLKELYVNIGDRVTRGHIVAQLDDEKSQLKPGMFINAEIEFVRGENARIAPFSSIVSRDNSKDVFLAELENKRAFFKPVTTGIIEGNKAEVLETADLSSFVVFLGQHLLQDGMSIILPETEEQSDSPQKEGKLSAPGR